MTLIPAKIVARRLGIKTETLAKWRRQGRGPKGWLYLSATLVCYPEIEIDKFLLERSRLTNRQLENVVVD